MKERSTNAWLSIAAYARTYGLTRASVKKWLSLGLLEHYRVHRLVRIKNQAPALHQKDAR